MRGDVRTTLMPGAAAMLLIDGTAHMDCMKDLRRLTAHRGWAIAVP